MIPANQFQIIRCLKRDGYTAEQGARYCRRIALGCAGNPWACPGDQQAYEEAARILEAEANQPAVERGW
jgi:hypothetical protein